MLRFLLALHHPDQERRIAALAEEVAAQDDITAGLWFELESRMDATRKRLRPLV